MKKHYKSNHNYNQVRAKKHLGQHFLIDLDIAQQIVAQSSRHNAYTKLLEIGPGMGVLTQYLLEKPEFDTWVVELDSESVVYLKKKFIALAPEKIIEADFLQLPLHTLFDGESFGIIGNFPYNISSQIFFKVLEYRDIVPEVVCMLQKEVAVRIASGPGKKDYGILSVLLQAFYDIDYAFGVPPEAFNPPPNVQSGVIRLRRNRVKNLPCNERRFTILVKAGFNQRRKTLRNALRAFALPDHRFMDKRAEQLSVDDFVELALLDSIVS